MKIFGRYPAAADIPQQVTKDVQEGRWYHFSRVTLIQTEKEITAVALNVLERFVALLWKVFGSNYYAHILKSKKAELLNPATLDQKKTEKPPVPPPLTLTGIAATGGMENSASTCFLISTLQALKVVPKFLELVQKSLQQRKNEMDDKFKKRQEVQRQIADIFDISFKGKTVPGQKLVDLRQTLSEYDPGLIKAGASGDLRDVWEILHDIFELPPFIRATGSKRGQPDRQCDIDIQNIPYHQTVKQDKYQGTPLDILPIFITIAGHPNKSIEIEPQPEIELDYSNQKVRYALTSCTANVSNFHARAYLKDKDSGKWAQFDDARVSPLAELTADQKKIITILYYQKV